MLRMENITKQYVVKDSFGRRKNVPALRQASLTLAAGEILGVAGESGSGKTTLARIALRLLPATSGTVYFHGRDISRLSRRELLDFRCRAQIIWQNPDSALDPRMTVEQAISEPLVIHRRGGRAQRGSRVNELLELVELTGALKDRYPRQLSSGQRQRVAVARALALSPELIICDEPVSLLDAALRLQVAELLLELRDRLGLSYLFISHDLPLLRLVSDRIAVMNAGEILETADTETFFESAAHPYSRKLLASLDRDPQIKTSKN